MRFKKYLMIISFIAVTFSCSQAQEKVEVIDADQLVELRDAGVELIDVRSLSELQDGKIPGATHIPISANFIEGMQDFDKTKPVIVYCHSGVRSTKAARQLSSAGFEKVYNYKGSYADWVQSGREVEKN